MIRSQSLGAEPPSPDPTSDFAQFYAAQFHGVTVALFAYTGDLSLAEQVAQEAFTRAAIRWERVRTYADPAAWVRRVAFDLVSRRRRRGASAGRRPEHQVTGPDPDQVALIRALATLPERQRRAVILHYLADMSVDDVARQEGVSPTTVEAWLHRGGARLAAELGDQRGVIS